MTQSDYEREVLQRPASPTAPPTRRQRVEVGSIPMWITWQAAGAIGAIVWSRSDFTQTDLIVLLGVFVIFGCWDYVQKTKQYAIAAGMVALAVASVFTPWVALLLWLTAGSIWLSFPPSLLPPVAGWMAIAILWGAYVLPS